MNAVARIIIVERIRDVCCIGIARRDQAVDEWRRRVAEDLLRAVRRDWLGEIVIFHCNHKDFTGCDVLHRQQNAADGYAEQRRRAQVLSGLRKRGFACAVRTVWFVDVYLFHMGFHFHLMCSLIASLLEHTHVTNGT